MLEIIERNDVLKWTNIVESFPSHDVYYNIIYLEALAQHGDGVPRLIHYKDDKGEACYVVMQKDIADDPKFNGLPKHEFFDWETPYGYGGPIKRGEFGVDSEKAMLEELTELCKAEGIVSQFVRFNPVLENQEVAPGIIENKLLKSTVFIDTTTKEIIDTNLDSKNRNVIRKAIKNGVEIKICSGVEYGAFIELYNQTMQKDNALDYYYFGEDYYKILSKLGDKEMIFYAMLEDKPIAASIILVENGIMHYHLSGSDMQYRNLCPSNLLLYTAALWGSENGVKKFHLGGGLSCSEEDNLFRFKKQFNKTGKIGFYIGKTIFNRDKYDYLMAFRANNDETFDKNNHLMIQYRG